MGATSLDKPATSGYLNRRLRTLSEACVEIGDNRLSLHGFRETVLRDSMVKMPADAAAR